jgi:xylulokinase
MALYLGFDCSTQSLSAIVIEVARDQRRIVFEDSLSFDRDFPEYGTAGGVVRGEQQLEVLASPLMWADALDRMMARIAREAGLDFGQLRGISGSAQQHGSVYLKRHAREAWRTLDHSRPLAPQLAGTLSRNLSPVWMDESAEDYGAAIERALDGPEATAQLTGSRAYARFTGPQIRKFHDTDKRGYEATGRIHLVSSFLASLLIGADAPLEAGDASGMNLMDLRTAAWSPAALEATAPGLDLKLPEIRPSWSVAGRLSKYWQDRYSFGATPVMTWTGDNPSSLVGTGIVSEGHLAVSLGTSDTAFALTHEPASGSSHVFGAPIGGFMNLVCFRNGSLTRDWVRRSHHLDWEQFAAALERTPAGNAGAVMLPWLEAEITPHVSSPGIRRFAYDGRDPAQDVRAVVEGQMMAMANHSTPIARDLKSIVATGGGSVNRAVLQVMADVFGAPVDQLAVANSACLGAALRALHVDRVISDEPLSWHSVVKGFTDPRAGERVQPVDERVELYRALRVRYAELEALHRDRAPIG